VFVNNNKIHRAKLLEELVQPVFALGGDVAVYLAVTIITLN